MSTLGTSKVDDWKREVDSLQDVVNVRCKDLKYAALLLYAKINAADADAMLTIIHGDDAAAKIAYKDVIKSKAQAANVPVTELYDATKQE